MKRYFKGILCLIWIILSFSFLNTKISAVSCEQGTSCTSSATCMDQNGICKAVCGPQRCCCESTTTESGITDWIKLIWGREDVPSELKILGLEMQTTELKNLIKTLIIISASGLVAALGAISAYGGILWVTAGDKEEQLQKAKKIVSSGAVGIVIVIFFFAVLGFMTGILKINIFNFSFLDEILK